jgi:hypothetical protein
MMSVWWASKSLDYPTLNGAATVSFLGATLLESLKDCFASLAMTLEGLAKSIGTKF